MDISPPKKPAIRYDVPTWLHGTSVVCLWWLKVKNCACVIRTHTNRVQAYTYVAIIIALINATLEPYTHDHTFLVFMVLLEADVPQMQHSSSDSKQVCLLGVGQSHTVHTGLQYTIVLSIVDRRVVKGRRIQVLHEWREAGDIWGVFSDILYRSGLKSWHGPQFLHCILDFDISICFYRRHNFHR